MIRYILGSKEGMMLGDSPHLERGLRMLVVLNKLLGRVDGLLPIILLGYCKIHMT